MLEGEKAKAIIELAIPRKLKNKVDEFETDYAECILLGKVAEAACEYCHSGDVVGIKGFINTEFIEESGNNKRVTNIVAERVTFLSSNNENKQEN